MPGDPERMGMPAGTADRNAKTPRPPRTERQGRNEEELSHRSAQKHIRSLRHGQELTGISLGVSYLGGLGALAFIFSFQPTIRVSGEWPRPQRRGISARIGSTALIEKRFKLIMVGATMFADDPVY
jgi:hypothetical protein